MNSLSRRVLLLFFGLVVLGTCSGAAFEIDNRAEAVNEAGRQRMLTQRMLKDYAMIGMGNRFAHPRRDLQKVIQTFGEHLEALKRFARDDEIRASLREQERLWTSVKKILQSDPEKKRVADLQKQLDELLHAADRTTRLFAASTGKKSGTIINISGRQRMLSQRMAALYMLRAWGVDDRKFRSKMDEAIALFADSHRRLLASTLNTPRIKRLLDEVGRDFRFFQVMGDSQKRFIPSLIYRKSDEILKKMNEVTGQYAQEKIQ